MHPTQIKILALAKERNIAKLKLREIGEFIGIPHPQIVKHHMVQLQKRGMLLIDKSALIASPISAGFNHKTDLLSLPILGTANCGMPTALAEESLEGYLKVSSKIVGRNSAKNLYVLKASGVSMNKANINGDHIENGDYVVVDSSIKVPSSQGKNYMVAVIDGCANIKNVVNKSSEGQVVLLSESTEDFPPIYLHADDNFMFSGKIIKVIKK